jgi:hypothetical protein
MDEKLHDSYTIDYMINNSNLANRHRRVQVHASPNEIQTLVEQGFLVREGMFSDEVLDRMRTAVDRLEAAERGHPLGEHIPGNGFYLRHLRDKDEVFRDLAFFEPPLSIARAVLGPQVWFDVDARIAYEGQAGKFVPWHIHKRVVPHPRPPFFSYPHGIHCLLYLDSVGEAEGALVVLPGSHRDDELYLPSGDTRDIEGQELLLPQAGDCLIVHANLWHRTLPTAANCGRRRLVLFGYEPSWTKSAVARGVKPTHPLTADLRKSNDPEVLELLDEWHW